MPVNCNLPTKSFSEDLLAISFGPTWVEWKVQPFAWMLCFVSYQPTGAYFGMFSLSGTANKREILDLAYKNRKKIAPLSRVHRFCTPAVLRHTQCTRDHAHVETTLASDWLPTPTEEGHAENCWFACGALLVKCILLSSFLSHRIGFFLSSLTVVFSWHSVWMYRPQPAIVSHQSSIN